MILCFK